MSLLRHDKSGFTLIELLIVVAIIGILAAIAVPNFLNAQMRAKLARVQADFRSINTAMQSYRLDNNDFPPDPGGPCVDVIAYTRLTTPVSYISSVEVFKDYFTSESPEGAIGADCAWNYYDYGMVDYIKQSGVDYVVVSFGPDRDLDMGWNDASMNAIKNRTATFLFHPSNGLSSSGDLILTGLGLANQY
ncbi:MAG: type II secretion system protein [bacterium]|jgi:type II secretion system protein G